jgi:hypothetical protein
MIKLEKNNYVLNNLFTRKFFNNITKHGKYNLYKEIAQEFVEDCDKKTNLQVIKELYSYISFNYRNEYFYINTMLQYMEAHRHKDISVFTQMPVGDSIADLIVIKGNYSPATVYEIKTELDNFSRLEKQIHDYYKCFSRVVVLTRYENHLALENFLDNIDYGGLVGIDVIGQNSTPFVIREPKQNNLLIKNADIFRFLHKKEYELILEFFGFQIPENLSLRYDACMQEFCKIDKQIVKFHLDQCLFSRRKQPSTAVFDVVPTPLLALAYFCKLSEKNKYKLEKFLLERFDNNG